MLATRHHPQFILQDGSTHIETTGYLWYPVKPERHTASFLDYLWEKLGITDAAEGQNALDQWNKAVRANNPRTVTARINIAGEDRTALIPNIDPSKPSMLLSKWTCHPMDIDYYHADSGRGGFAWFNYESISTSERKYEEQKEEA